MVTWENLKPYKKCQRRRQFIWLFLFLDVKISFDLAPFNFPYHCKSICNQYFCNVVHPNRTKQANQKDATQWRHANQKQKKKYSKKKRNKIVNTNCCNCCLKKTKKFSKKEKKEDCAHRLLQKEDIENCAHQYLMKMNKKKENKNCADQFLQKEEKENCAHQLLQKKREQKLYSPIVVSRKFKKHSKKSDRKLCSPIVAKRRDRKLCSPIVAIVVSAAFSNMSSPSQSQHLPNHSRLSTWKFKRPLKYQCYNFTLFLKKAM